MTQMTAVRAESMHLPLALTVCVLTCTIAALAAAVVCNDAGDRAATAVCNDAGDRAALTRLYDSAAGVQWLKQDNWLSNLPLDAWTGVACNSASGRVKSLQLVSNNMAGGIPPLTGLDQLEQLRVENNPQLVSVASFEGLPSLTTLQLGGLSLSTLPSLAPLTKLHSADLSTNRQAARCSAVRLC